MAVENISNMDKYETVLSFKGTWKAQSIACLALTS